jgi:hypothetical protein
MMDPDDAIDFVSKALKDVGYDVRALPPPLQVVHLISGMNLEIMQGGVYGWLVNNGEYGPDTVKAFEAVGAHQCAAIVREMLAFFPEGTPASDGRERVQQMEDIGEVGESRWDELRDRLLAWPDDIYALLQKFISEHEADFS